MITLLKNYLYTNKRKKILQDLSYQSYNKLSKKPYIGVIAELFEQTQLDQLIEFYKEQNWLQVPCNILLFVNEKEFDLPFHFHFYTTKDVNWYEVPAYEKAKSFVGAKYEKLIVLNPKNRKHIHFLASITNAQVTCGLASFDEFQSYYQLMVDLKDAGNYKKVIDEIYEHYGKLI